MLFDPFGRPIRKQRFFGFGHVPARESRMRLDPDPSGSNCVDAIGFPESPEDDEVDDPGEPLEIHCRKEKPCDTSSRQ